MKSSKLSEKLIENWRIGVVELILVISAIFLLFFNWIISWILFGLALGIPLVYFYLGSLRLKLKIFRRIPKAQACLVFGGLIVAAILIISTINIIL
ncbi:MAG: hypothetical protein ACFFE4_06220 [Candidatus Thorarchaeota archaeon]